MICLMDRRDKSVSSYCLIVINWTTRLHLSLKANLAGHQVISQVTRPLGPALFAAFLTFRSFLAGGNTTSYKPHLPSHQAVARTNVTSNAEHE